jgi:prepilin-type N-terminal cleavage/methylation domain-containing protein
MSFRACGGHSRKSGGEMKRNSSGFTLIELIVAASIVGILSIGLATVSVNALTSTANTNQTAEVLNELRVANSYMADNIRQASYIYPETISIKLPDGSLCEFASTSKRCLAFIRPKPDASGSITQDASGLIKNELLVIYQFEDRSKLDQDSKACDSWADGAPKCAAAPASFASPVWYLKEYQYPFSSNDSMPTDLSGEVLTPSIILDYVDKGYNSSLGKNKYDKPFTLTGTDQVTLKLRQTRRIGGQQLYVPADSAAGAPQNATATKSKAQAGFLQTTVTLRNTPSTPCSAPREYFSCP